MAIRKHWEKILLAVFAIFWSGCENGAAYNPEDSSIYAPLYGVSVPDDSMVVDSMIVDQPALYGPPCVFNGTCGDESVTNENPGQE